MTGTKLSAQHEAKMKNGNSEKNLPVYAAGISTNT